MKIAPYVQKLNNSKEYKDFLGKNKDAFMVAGFFILDFELGKNIHQIDYYVPSNKKVAAFTLDKGVTLQLLETMNQKIPEKLDLDTKIDLDALKGILQDEMKNRSITEDIKKIIAILQNIDGKKIWNINCILTGMEILRAHIEDESKSILKMEKVSILDYVKKIPASELSKMAGTMKQQGKEGQMKEESTKEKIKKLEQLEEAIEKEKKKYETELEKGNKNSKEKAQKTSKKKN